ncbi:uncharacterized protein LOC114365949 [Ostrinia furnacalis]|uniref:uncharacterized protein LOC114365949 n=1 Tax=Ostrinia furnacalis TaxID=93504 RepID=UPI001039EEBA|nr:uncharacterized protein LOC114365949 [Ostrinia furnacalis]
MEISRKSCRLCLSETEFNVSLFGNYCRRTNMIEKILVCLKLVIEDSDTLDTICYKCAESVERYYDFVARVKKCQTRYKDTCHEHEPRQRSMELSPTHVKRHVTSYVREQVYDADYTFSFLEMPNNDEKKESKVSSPFFSYFSPPNVLAKQPCVEPMWKTPKPRESSPKKELLNENRYKRPYKPEKRSRHHSRDLFESQSQDVEEPEPKSLDWKLTPDDNLIKRVREKCFGRSDF